MLSEENIVELQHARRMAACADGVIFLNAGPNEEDRVRMQLAMERLGHPYARLAMRHVVDMSTVRRWCALLWRRLRDLDWAPEADVVLILADTVEVTPVPFDLPDLPQDWSVVFLGGLHLQPPRIVRGPAGIVRPIDLHAIGAMLVRRSRLPHLRRELRSRYHQEGWEPWPFNTLCRCRGVYCVFPNLFWSNNINAPITTDNECDDLFEAKSGKQLIAPAVAAQTATAILLDRPPEEPRCNPFGRDGVRRRPRLTILFLSINGLLHDRMWEEYVSSSAGPVTGLLYARHPDRIEGAFSQRILSKLRAYTEWGHISLVKVMLALLREALDDSQATHFCFASESCVPIRPAREALGMIATDARSRIDPEPLRDFVTHRDRPPTRALLRSSQTLHSQWILLDRSHAELVTRRDFTDDFRRSFAPDETYFGTVLKALGVDMDTEVRNTNVTWKEWPGRASPHPRTWNQVDQCFIDRVRRSDAFFMRKVAKTSNIPLFCPHVDGGTS